jgi:serine phosphatase RsbU (regulator of sigma subunit)
VTRLLLFLFLFVCPLLKAQDTLDAFLKKVPNDTNGVRMLIKSSDRLGLQNGEKSLAMAKKALELAEKCSFEKLIADALLSVSNRLITLGEYDNAVPYMQRASSICDSLHYLQGQSRIELLTGNLFSYQEQYDEALKHYLRALPATRQINHLVRLAAIYNNIGVIYYEKARKDSSYFALSKLYFDSSYTIALASGDQVKILDAMNNLAMVLTDLHQYERARIIADSVVNISLAEENLSELAYGYSHIGEIHLVMHKYDSAIYYFEKAYHCSREVTDYMSITKALEGLSDAYAGKGDYKNAWMYYVKFSELSDSIRNESNLETVNNLRNKVEAERKDRTINSLRQENEISELQNGRKTWLLISAVAGILLLALFGWFMFARARSREKINTLLTAQNELVSKKNKDITDSINYAQRIQQILLGQEEVFKSGLKEHFIFFRPKDIVSGDFYWCTETSNAFYYAVCDSTGHGVPGAFMSLLNISFLNEAVIQQQLERPEEILNYCRKRLTETVSAGGAEDGMDCTLIRIERQTRTLTYAAANNPPVLIRNNTVLAQSYDKMPVGRSPKDNIPFTGFTVDILPGDMLYLFTDGFSDQFGGPKGKKFKSKNLLEAFRSLSSEALPIQCEKLTNLHGEWRGDLDQVDDILIIGIRFA